MWARFCFRTRKTKQVIQIWILLCHQQLFTYCREKGLGENISILGDLNTNMDITLPSAVIYLLQRKRAGENISILGDLNTNMDITFPSESYLLTAEKKGG